MDMFYNLKHFLVYEKFPESPSFCSRWERKTWGAAFYDSDFCCFIWISWCPVYLKLFSEAWYWVWSVTSVFNLTTQYVLVHFSLQWGKICACVWKKSICPFKSVASNALPFRWTQFPFQWTAFWVSVISSWSTSVSCSLVLLVSSELHVLLCFWIKTCAPFSVVGFSCSALFSWPRNGDFSLSLFHSQQSKNNFQAVVNDMYEWHTASNAEDSVLQNK